MEVEFDTLYKSLSVHHLDREEIEFELGVRGLPFTETESRAAIARRLKEKLKEEREKNYSDFDFTRLDTTVDAEIGKIDSKVNEIRDFLTKVKQYDGNVESLKTRLVHYFARAKLLLDCTDLEQDLSDIEAIQSCIRSTYNNFFSVFSVMAQQQLYQSLSNLSVNTQRASSDKSDAALQVEEEGTSTQANVGARQGARRVLKNCRK